MIINLVTSVNIKEVLPAIYLIVGTCKVIEAPFTVATMHIVKSNTSLSTILNTACNRNQVDDIARQFNL